MEPTVATFCTDLIFGTKITSTAESVGVKIRLVRGLEEFAGTLSRERAGLVLIDLNAAGPDPLEAIRAARQCPDPPRVVAFCAHVQSDLIAAARQVGADEVMSRSAFCTALPRLLEAAAHSQPD